jgi:hypothetical protein
MVIIIEKNTKKILPEKMALSDYGLYLELVADAYEKAPEYESSAVPHWTALRDSNYVLFKRLLSKIDVVFVTKDKSKEGEINIMGRSFPIKYLKGGQPYDTQPQMKREVLETKMLRINIDYSEHPIFSVADNIVMRTVHDYIVHILGDHGFGGKGEIAAFNLHARLAPEMALPALFTEVVGQAAYAVTRKKFLVQKIAVLDGFDYKKLGQVDDEDYEIIGKKLVKKGEDIVSSKKNINPKDFVAVRGEG